MMFHSIRRPDVLSVTLAAAGILMVTMGTRQSFGLFISPINSSTGMGIATIILALAIGQFTWGAIQPIAGAVADRYGLGGLYAGSCVARYRSKYVLAAMYASLALLIVWYLWMPRTEWPYYLFAAGLGFTWLATVPPTAAIVGKLFGTRYLATLFGLTLLSHQIGGFLGAWLGGITISRFGDFSWMWYADIALAILAAW